jgi:large subunit ribosomal protein L30e
MNEKKLKKMLKDAVTDKKMRTGTKEVLQYIKGTNLILYSNTLPAQTLDKIKKISESSNIPIYRHPGNSISLGRLCSLSYGTSMVSLKNVPEEDVNSILNAT